jgi:hypothetical protein
MAYNNTAFSPNPDKVAQLTGSGLATPGFTGPSTTGTGLIPVYGTAIALDPFLQNSSYVYLTGDNTNACTVTIASVKAAGHLLGVQFNSPAAGNTSVLTFGTGFRSTGTVQPTASKCIVVTFISDGTTYNESGRTSASLT